MTNKDLITGFIVVVQTYPPVNVQRQTLTIGRSAYFSLR